MTDLTRTAGVQTLLDKVAGLSSAVGGDARLKRIVRKMTADLFDTIDEFDVSEEEFWHALNFVAAGAPEFGLWAPGLGIERFLDIRQDAKDKAAGVGGGTPRTIEGPLYVPGAPLETGTVRLDDGSDDGEVLIMHGQVRGADGAPVAGAVVDVWHANTKGNYSYFDPTQSAYNLRRRVRADSEGRYRFRTIMPAGYAVPPGSKIDAFLGALGRHGKRPAHIHFFVSAAGQRHLTTQINIDGDPYLHDDFAYATRDALIPPFHRRHEPDAIRHAGLTGPFTEIEFDFVLPPATVENETRLSSRQRVPASG